MEFNFDKSKIFYPYAINYIISLHGLVELFSRYGYEKIIKAKNKGLDLEAIIKQQEVTEQKHVDFIKEIYNHNLVPTLLLGKFSLKSEKNKNSTEISINNLTLEFVDNHPYLLPFQIKAAGTLLVMAHHVSKHLDDKSELWNFFYHCRNAAAHGGQFNITNPRFPAKWGNMQITKAINGTNLFNDGTTPGLIGLADPLLFLLDVEKKLSVEPETYSKFVPTQPSLLVLRLEVPWGAEWDLQFHNSINFPIQKPSFSTSERPRFTTHRFDLFSPENECIRHLFKKRPKVIRPLKSY